MPYDGALLDVPITTMRRIAVIGCPGSGKTWIASQLAAQLGLPHVELDHHFWGPGWVPMDAEPWRHTVERLSAEPEWIIDGNYEATLALRLTQSDWLIWADLDTATCLHGVLRRMLQWKLQPPSRLPVHMRRPGRSAQVSKDFGKFLRFVAGFRRNVRPRLRRLVDEHCSTSSHVTVISSRAHARWLVDAVAAQAQGRA